MFDIRFWTMAESTWRILKLDWKNPGKLLEFFFIQKSGNPDISFWCGSILAVNIHICYIHYDIHNIIMISCKIIPFTGIKLSNGDNSFCCIVATTDHSTDTKVRHWAHKSSDFIDWKWRKLVYYCFSVCECMFNFRMFSSCLFYSFVFHVYLYCVLFLYFCAASHGVIKNDDHTSVLILAVVL